jgi:serine/threonine protein kinase
VCGPLNAQLLHNELVPAIPLQFCLKAAFQAARGMYFLHSSGIVHRDLKSLNLLLDSKWNLKVKTKTPLMNREHGPVAQIWRRRSATLD